MDINQTIKWINGRGWQWSLVPHATREYEYVAKANLFTYPKVGRLRICSACTVGGTYRLLLMCLRDREAWCSRLVEDKELSTRTSRWWYGELHGPTHNTAVAGVKRLMYLQTNKSWPSMKHLEQMECL